MGTSRAADQALADHYGVPLEELRSRWDGMTIVGPGDARPKVIKTKPSESVRSRVINRDGPFCRFCGRKLLIGGDGVWRLTLDHLLPKSRGGLNTVQNLVVACSSCNNRKGDRTVEEAGMVLFDPHPEGDAYAACPDCDGDVWDATTGRVCWTCQGAGVLTAAAAVDALVRTRRLVWRKDTVIGSLRRQVVALRAAVEERDGTGSSRPAKALAETVERLKGQVRQMSDRLLVMKVEMAEATGADLARLIPHPPTRERALELASVSSPDLSVADDHDHSAGVGPERTP